MNMNDYHAEFEKIISRPYFSDKINGSRTKAFEKFIKSGIPNRKWENWRHTDLSIILKEKFRVPEKIDAPNNEIDLKDFKIEGAHTFVIYNGHYQESSEPLPEGLKVLTNLEYLERNNWGNNSIEKSPFDLLNTSLCDSGISLVIDDNIELHDPIQIVFFCSSNDQLMVCPRINVDINKSSSATIIEHYIDQSELFFQNTSMVISLKDNASLNHVCIQSNTDSAVNVSNLHVSQMKDSRYNFFQFIDGGGLSRSNIYTYLENENAECFLSGITLSNKKQHFDTNIITDHISPNCTSHQNFKSVLNGNSTGVFNGRTIVRENSQKTDSRQSNKNLLLSENAMMNSNPQLEIYADDVKCAHGSTTGALDEEALFYLRSRGIDRKSASSLLIRGFVSELIDEVNNLDIKNYLFNRFDNWLKTNN